MLAAGMVVWSLAQIVSGAVQGFGQFLLARGVLGVDESPMFTAGARASVNWFPVKARGLPLGLFNASSSLGPAIAPPLLTALMLAFGWRPMFMLMGALGLIAAAVFSVLGPLAPTTGLALGLMSAALFCAYGAGSCSWALGATVAPPDAVATLESVQNIGGSIGGALARWRRAWSFRRPAPSIWPSMSPPQRPSYRR